MKNLKIILVATLLTAICILGFGQLQETEHAQEIAMIQNYDGQIYDMDVDTVSFEIGTKLVTCQWSYVDNYLENELND